MPPNARAIIPPPPNTPTHKHTRPHASKQVRTHARMRVRSLTHARTNELSPNGSHDGFEGGGIEVGLAGVDDVAVDVR